MIFYPKPQMHNIYLANLCHKVESKKYQKVFSKRSRIAGAHVHLGTARHHPEATKNIYSNVSCYGKKETCILASTNITESTTVLKL
jgi:hypothetical protein